MYAMGRKHLKAGVEKKFAIPLRSCASSPASKDGGIRDFAMGSAQVLDRGANAINRELVRSWVVYDSALAYLFPARFKLRLDQDDRLDNLADGGEDRGQDQGGGDK